MAGNPLDGRTARILLDANLALTESLNPAVVFSKLLDLLAELVPYDTANIMLLDERGWMAVHTIRGYERFGNIDKTTRAAFDTAAHPIFKALMATLQPVLIADTHAHADWQRHAGAEHVRNWIGVPLVAGGKAIGLYALDKAEPHFFTAEHLHLTQALAPQAAIAIQNARLFDQVERGAVRLAAIFETSYDAFVAMDRNGRVSQWNPRAEAMFGWPRSEAVGRVLADLIVPAQHREAHRKGLERFLKTGEGPVLNRLLELTALHRDGHEFPVELKISSVQLGDECFFDAFIHDITDRKRLEDLRDDLVHTMVHDLRNPLTSLMGSLDGLAIAASVSISGYQRELLANARRNTAKLLALIDSILDVSRLEQSALPLELEPIRLDTLVDEVILMELPLAREKHIRLESEVSSDLPRVTADRSLLLRVVQNLVGNAIAYTPSGGEVRIGAAHDAVARTFRVTVSDTGMGIPDEVRSRLFQKFVRGPQKGRGSGLGLAFCKLAVDAHGGRIEVESDAESGTRVTVTLPAELEAPPRST